MCREEGGRHVVVSGIIGWAHVESDRLVRLHKTKKRSGIMGLRWKRYKIGNRICGVSPRVQVQAWKMLGLCTKLDSKI